MSLLCHEVNSYLKHTLMQDRQAIDCVMSSTNKAILSNKYLLIYLSSLIRFMNTHSISHRAKTHFKASLTSSRMCYNITKTKFT